MLVINENHALVNDFRVRNIGVDEGLSYFHTTGIIQDAKGFVWISTLNGLNRLDGNSVINYFEESDKYNGLKNDRFLSICEDSYQNIWSGTGYSGVQIYNVEKNTFTNILLDKENALNNVVASIIRLSNGDMLCGTRSGELFLFTKKATKDISEGKEPKFIKLKLSAKAQEKPIDRIVEICEGLNEIWLIDWSGNLFRIDYSNKNNKKYSISFIESNGVTFRDIVKTKNNKILGATSLGLYCLETNQIERETFSNWKLVKGTEKSRVSGIAIDKNDFVWISARSSLFDNHIYRVSDLDNGSPKVLYYDIDIDVPIRIEMIDKSNVLWISSTTSGVYSVELSFKKFNKFKRLNSILEKENNQYVNISLIDTRDYFWTGGEAIGVLVYDLDRKKEIYKNNSINPTAILEDRSKNIWVSTRNGVYYMPSFRDKKLSITSENKIDFSKWGHRDLSNIRFNSIDEDLYGNIWLVSDKELLYCVLDTNGIIKNVKVLEKERATKLSFCDIKSVKAHPNISQLWIMQRGCGFTVMTYDRNLENIQSENFSVQSENYITSNTVNNIYFEKNNDVWLTTDNGLNRLTYSNEHSKYILHESFNIKHGLANNLVETIEKDANNNLWIGTNKGLSFYDTNKRIFRTFTTKDGLVSNVFTNSSLKNKDGILFFGTNKGYVAFIPKEIELNASLPIGAFTSLSVFNKKIEINEKIIGNNAILTKSLVTTNEIIIDHKQNDFTIGFAALHYAVPEKNKFSYILEGYHDAWIETTASAPFASFANLSPGDYTLKLKVSNNDGFWSEHVKTLKISILPPIWKTVWAYMLYILMFLGLLYLIIYIWGARLKYRNEIILQKAKIEKEKELNEMKLRFFTDISHEFRTPLTLIYGPIIELMEQFKNNSKVYSILLPLNLNINRMLRLLNQLLDFRKAESNQLKLYLSKGDLMTLLRNIKDSYVELANSKNITLKLETECDEYITWYDEDKLDKIVHNLLSNAFKYTSNNGSVIINFKIKNDNGVVISIIDTGKGIPQRNKQKVFERFFQSEDAAMGTGIGLALVKKLVEIHKGSILVDSVVDKGSTFTIDLPVGKEFFFDEIQKQVAKEGIEDTPLWLSASYEEEKYEEDNDDNTKDENVPLILIVEDNKDILNYIQHLLNPNFRTIIAEDGLLGEKNAKSFLPDLIISDISMPNMTGVEMCKTLKEDNNTAHIPLIFLTAKYEDKYKIEGLSIGATDYISKPFDPKELKTKVENILNDLKKNKDRLRKDFILSPSKVQAQSPEEIFLQKAVQIVEENMSNGNFNLLFFCEKLGVGRMQLHRKFKMFTGQSTTEFIRSIRLKRAAQLLEKGHLTAIEVMYEVGIESNSYFSKAFKKQYGKTPREYSLAVQNKKP